MINKYYRPTTVLLVGVKMGGNRIVVNLRHEDTVLLLHKMSDVYLGTISKCNDDWIVLTEYGILTIPFMRDDYMELV